MTEFLFVYGTLQDSDIQTHIIGRVIEGTPDQLQGYMKMLIQTPQGIYPMAIPHDNEVISGLVLEIAQEELERIDHYEGSAYLRVEVKLVSGRVAWVYRDNPALGMDRLFD